MQVVMIQPPSSDENKSFAKSLFFGKILEDMVFPYPKIPEEEKETAKLLIDSIRQYSEKSLDTKKIDQEETIPKEVLSALAEMGLFGIKLLCFRKNSEEIRDAAVGNPDFRSI